MIRSEAPLQIVPQSESKSSLGAKNSGQDIFGCIALSPESGKIPRICYLQKLMLVNLPLQIIWSTLAFDVLPPNLTEPKSGEAQENGKSPGVWKLACKSLQKLACLSLHIWRYANLILGLHYPWAGIILAFNKLQFCGAARP